MTGSLFHSVYEVEILCPKFLHSQKFLRNSKILENTGLCVCQDRPNGRSESTRRKITDAGWLRAELGKRDTSTSVEQWEAFQMKELMGRRWGDVC